MQPRHLARCILGTAVCWSVAVNTVFVNTRSPTSWSSQDSSSVTSVGSFALSFDFRDDDTTYVAHPGTPGRSSFTFSIDRISYTASVFELVFSGTFGTKHKLQATLAVKGERKASVYFSARSHLFLQIGEEIFHMYEGVLPPLIILPNHFEGYGISNVVVSHGVLEGLTKLEALSRPGTPFLDSFLPKAGLSSPAETIDRCPGQEGVQTSTRGTRHTQLLSVSVWINLKIEALSADESCIVGIDGFKISYIGTPLLPCPTFRLTVLDSDGGFINLDLPYEVTPDYWYHIVAEFVSESVLSLSVDKVAQSRLETNVANSIKIPEPLIITCLTCSTPFQGPRLQGSVANVHISAGLDLPGQTHRANNVGDEENETTGRTLSIVLVSRAGGGFDHENSIPRILLALQAICDKTPSNVRNLIREIIVDYPNVLQQHGVYWESCKSIRVSFLDLQQLSWLQKIVRGVQKVSAATETVIISDWNVVFTSTTLSGLIEAIKERNNTVAASIITDILSDIQVAGYDLDWQTVLDKDYILPVQQFRGYPHSHSRVGLPRVLSTLSGHVFALGLAVLRKVLPALQILGEAQSTVSPVLADVDFFLQLERAGIAPTLAKNSLATGTSSLNEAFLRDSTIDIDGANIFAARWQNYLSKRLQEIRKSSFGLRWMMHCAGSMGGEALTIISGLEGRVQIRTQITRPIPYCEHNTENIKTAPVGLQELYHRLHELGPPNKPEIVIFHRDYRLFGELVRGTNTSYNIGRYMFEGNGSLHKHHVGQLFALDEIWVPSHFHKQLIVTNGLPAEKIVVIPEAVDVELMRLIANRHRPLYIPGLLATTFKFLSVFKLEDRKGWHQLVEGYCLAFTSSDDVVLVLHTYVYGVQDGWNPQAISKYISDHLDAKKCKEKSKHARPIIHISGKPLSSVDLVRLYTAADAYVSAHWGEGWGLPLSEAMSLGLPTIATDFSGNTEFMTKFNSFLVPIGKMVPYDVADQWFGGMYHAQLDTKILARTLRYVFANPIEARKRGDLGQQTMQKLFSPQAVANLVLNRLQIIEQKMRLNINPVKLPHSLRSNPGFSDLPEVQVCSNDIDFLQGKRPSNLKGDTHSLKLAIISTYPPKPCGIAVFTENLVNGMKAAFQGIDIEVIALTNDIDHYSYPKEVTRFIREGVFHDYVKAAQYINEGKFDAVFLQHEYGIYGPRPSGGYVVCLAKLIEVPLVTTFHTVLSRLNDNEGSVLQLLNLLSTKTIVMTASSKKMLEGTFFVSEGVSVVPHGAPDVRLHTDDRNVVRNQMAWNGKIVLVGNGLIHRGKGYEYMIQALPALRKHFPKIIFCIIGKPHPSNPDSSAYLEELRRTVAILGLDSHVQFVSVFSSFKELGRLLQAADMFIAPYTDDSVSSSGTLTMAMAAGLPCVATPFIFAKVSLSSNRGVMVRFNDHLALASAVSWLLRNPEASKNIGRNAWGYMQERTWLRVGLAYVGSLRSTSH